MAKLITLRQTCVYIYTYIERVQLWVTRHMGHPCFGESLKGKKSTDNSPMCKLPVQFNAPDLGRDICLGILAPCLSLSLSHTLSLAPCGHHPATLRHSGKAKQAMTAMWPAMLQLLARPIGIRDPLHHYGLCDKACSLPADSFIQKDGC